jgi:hypothetical protein
MAYLENWDEADIQDLFVRFDVIPQSLLKIISSNSIRVFLGRSSLVKRNREIAKEIIKQVFCVRLDHGIIEPFADQGDIGKCNDQVSGILFVFSQCDIIEYEFWAEPRC